MGKFLPHCLVCTLPEKEAIETMIRHNISLDLIATRYQIETRKIAKHRDHMGIVGQPTQVLHQEIDAEQIFSEHEELKRQARRLVKAAEVKGDFKGQALGLREWRGALDQQARMLGAYDHVDPRLQNSYMTRIIKAIVVALDPMPEAREQVLKAIEHIEKGNPP